jgi:hypothetical protein
VVDAEDSATRRASTARVRASSASSRASR